jgi:glycosyltransferase involved in cell wall biosynthesis
VTRILFLNEALLGPGMMGHGALDAAMREALADATGVRARFASLPPLQGTAKRLVDDVRGLRRFDVDLQQARWHAVQSLRARRLVLEAMEDEPIDVLHVHTQAVAMALGDIMRRIPTALSVDCTVAQHREQEIWRPLRRHSMAALRPALAFERRAFRDAATVMAWSGWACDGVRAVEPTAAVTQLNPGVDLTRYRPVTERAHRDRLRILFVGARFTAKGGEDLVWALAPRLGRDVEIDAVTRSDLPQIDGLHQHRLGPGDPRLVELHRQADIMCLPTYGDAWPFAVAEALASGTPVVAAAIGAIPEMLGHGAAGAVVTPGDRDGLRRTLNDLLDDPDRRAEMGAAGRARAEDLYDAGRQNERRLELLSQHVVRRR